MQLSISSSGSVAANVRFGRQLSRQLSRKSMVSIKYEISSPTSYPGSLVPSRSPRRYKNGLYKSPPPLVPASLFMVSVLAKVFRIKPSSLPHIYGTNLPHGGTRIPASFFPL